MSASPAEPSVSAWKPIVCGAMAGGMAWGIRGQYGHETGAMIAGLLLGLTLVLLCCPRLTGGEALKAVAWMTIAMGFGGSMTYGQTVGLTHDVELVGNREALLWGMLGLAIKGGIWIGFAGTFLGMGLGGQRYRALEMLFVMLGLLGLNWIGVQLLNEPFDPARRSLPAIYFSDSWAWEPTATLKPRREVWGGMLLALMGLIAYARGKRGDVLAFRLGLWAVLGGALGFPLGQCLQAFHAWNPELFRQGIWQSWDPLMNWWNWMETTFGAVMGAALGYGLWRNRHLVRSVGGAVEVGMPFGTAVALWTLHLGLLVAVEFFSVGWVDRLYDFGLCLGLIPVVCVAGYGRWSLWVPTLTLLPIAGKTVREMVYSQSGSSLLAVSPILGWCVLLILPLAASLGLALWIQREGRLETPARRSLVPLLLFYAWVFFLLNYAFFRFPWPWASWTVRTPNALVYTVCVFGLTALALRCWRPVLR